MSDVLFDALQSAAAVRTTPTVIEAVHNASSVFKSRTVLLERLLSVANIPARQSRIFLMVWASFTRTDRGTLLNTPAIAPEVRQQLSQLNEAIDRFYTVAFPETVAPAPGAPVDQLTYSNFYKRLTT